MGVETYAATTSEVLASITMKSDALISYLRSQGIAETDLQTTNLSMFPTYGNYTPEAPTPITGYQASLTITVQLDDLTQASAVVDGAAFAVGDAFRIQGLSWSIKDRDALLSAARTNAIKNAGQQAKEYATAAGWDLGDLVSISETAGAAPYYGMGGEGDIPLNPGSQQLQVSVTVVYNASSN